MKWQPAFTYKIKQVIAITIWWVLIGIFVELHNAVNVDPATHKHFLFFAFGNSAFGHLLITAVGPFVGGLTAGSFIVFYQREKLRGKTYGQKLLIHSLLYLLFLSICILLVGGIGALNSRPGENFLEKFYLDVFSLRVLRLLIDWYFIVIITIFLLDVSERYGSGILRKLLLGKYYKPGKEERIFMFLDLRSSTAIAEQIGDEKYFRMLRFFYQVANEAVINNHGEIYQYVGDEIVVSWTKKTGLQNANCIRCFTAIEDIVQLHAETFNKQFEVVPSFKAAIHIGEVATGEIGTVKKDIVYSGDVLNTTARIVALCNQYKEKLIISETLQASLGNVPGYSVVYIDSPVLKGKRSKLDLFAVR